MRCRLPIRSVLLAFFLVASFAVDVSAADRGWPAFRGPSANGHAFEANPPANWDESQNVLWKVAIDGEGWSTPAVADGRIYLTVARPIAGEGEPTDLSLRLLALDALTGESLLDVEVFRQDAETAPSIHSKNSHASPSPVVAGDDLFVHFGHQGTACLSREGQVRWRTRDFAYRPVHGNGGSPLLVDDVLAFNCDGGDQAYIVGLDRDSGKQRWRTPRDSEATRTFSFATPAAISVEGETQLITPGSNRVDALDPASGARIWHVTYDGYSVIPQPIFGHGLVYVCTGYDRPSMIAIRPTGRGDVTNSHIAWRSERFAPHTPSLLLHEQDLYAVSDRGVATCRDALTGEIHWRQRLEGGYSASPILADGRIYFLNEEGVATVIEPGHRYREVATNRVPERTLASLVAIEDRLYLRGDRHLYCLVTSAPEERPARQTPPRQP